ncbi:hypothetical protein [Achromobacter sp. K91]|uniref:hypothetical protein n=1 Tax=Achromobacter sp. K91 TaxID=2292262 RepID=UPI0011C36353|nr:hypothetical protein [Achromobacter sp. K91]
MHGTIDSLLLLLLQSEARVKKVAKFPTDRFVVEYPTPKAVILAGRQTVKGLGLHGSHVDVLLRLNGLPCLQAKLTVNSSGRWGADFLMTPGTYVLHGWANKVRIPFPFVEGIAPPPDIVVSFLVWEA